jgi:hypothetical protein
MTGYYKDKLAAEMLRQCYDLAPERFCQLTAGLSAQITLTEVDDSSLFGKLLTY